MKIPKPKEQKCLPVVLTIAGSDSGGGAGIQADLKTFASTGIFGTTALTCLTAQNPEGVDAVEVVSPDMVTAQIKAVTAGFPLKATKTGMLYGAETIRTVVAAVNTFELGRLVVDPVMIATSGARLLADDAVEAMCTELLPLADVVTPNLPEAEVLCGHAIESRDALVAAAEEIGTRFGVACITKGGHLDQKTEDDQDVVVDVLYASGRTKVLASPRLPLVESHGTGCTFSAALTAYLALGFEPPMAFEQARLAVIRAIRHAVKAGDHYPLGIGDTGIEPPKEDAA